MQLLTLAIIFFTGLIIFYYKLIYEVVRDRLRIYHYLRKFEGPLAFPLVGNLYMVNIFNISQLTVKVMQLAVFYCNKGCGIVRLWVGPVPMLAVVNPAYAKEILESTEVITKANEYDILFPWLGTGLLTSTGKRFSKFSVFSVLSVFGKLCSWLIKLVSFKCYVVETNGANVGKCSLRPFISKCSTTSCVYMTIKQRLSICVVVYTDVFFQVFLEQLKPHADSGKEVDLFPFIKRMALDIICETSMGASVNAQNNHDHPYVKSVHRLSEIAFLWIIYPWLKLKPLWYLTGYGSEYDRHLKVVTDFTKNVIEEKWEEYQQFQLGTEKKDKRSMAFLDLLLQLRSEGLMNEEDIREEVDTFMFEGEFSSNQRYYQGLVLSGHDTTAASIGWTLWCLAHNPEIQEKVIEEVDRIFGTSDRDCTNEDLKQMKYLEKCLKESLRMFPSVPFFGRRVEKDTVISEFPPFAQSIFLLFHFQTKFAMMEEKAVISWLFRKYRVTASKQFEENKILPELIMKSSLGFPLTVRHRMENK
ncbi:CRE-CYP-37B1 protein [Caenorhabditis remanei]|uniref:CRE-CYP-37B1 protein n=1 Tax=Caenorhabditis remanei TaxID=31234 RepID=E3MZ79_CAERE|nr:CRE-CYP-37B1 protein [Caenorhabditis remanei]